MSSLKIAVIYDPPKSTSCALDFYCALPGYGMEFARFVCQSLNLSCTYHWYKGDYGNGLENGTGTDLVGAIQRGEFDTSLPVFTFTEKRAKAIDFSETYDVSDSILFTRLPPVKQELNWNIVFAFQIKVWLAYFVTLFMTAGLICLIRKLSSNTFFLTNWVTSFLYVCKTLVTIAFRETDLRSTSTRIVLFAWIISVFTLTGVYTGMLYSHVVFVKYDLPYTDVETFVQCLERRECRIITNTSSGGNLLQLLGSSDNYQDRIGKRVRESLIKNPWMNASVEEIPGIILREQNQYLVNVGPRGNRLSWIEGNRKCLYYTLGLPYVQTKAFPFSKNANADLVKKINKIVSASREFGLVEALDRKYKSELLCQEDWSSSHPIPLKLGDGRMLFSMIPCYGLYSLGVLIALITLAMEALANGFGLRREHLINYMFGLAQ